MSVTDKSKVDETGVLNYKLVRLMTIKKIDLESLCKPNRKLQSVHQYLWFINCTVTLSICKEQQILCKHSIRSHKNIWPNNWTISTQFTKGEFTIGNEKSFMFDYSK